MFLFWIFGKKVDSVSEAIKAIFGYTADFDACRYASWALVFPKLKEQLSSDGQRHSM